MSSFAKQLANQNHQKFVAWYRAQYTLKKHSLPLTSQNVPELFKSKNFLIVNKPYDLIVYEFKSVYCATPSLYELIKEKYPYYYDPRITGGYHVLHRLDAVTSGCMCVPLNETSLKIAMKAFVKGHVEKYYLGLVYGKINLAEIKCFGAVVKNEEIEVNMPMGDDLTNPGHSRCALFNQEGIRSENCSRPQNTITKIKLLEYGTYKGKDCTKVLLQPITGKRHQLRVVMQHLGYPVVGDDTYGIGDFDTYRTMLHSYRLQIKINTKERQFIKGKAPDPFMNSTDPDWIPNTTINKLTV